VVLVAARFFGDTLSHRVFCSSHPMAVGALFYSADAALPLLHCASRTISVVAAQNESAREIAFMSCVQR
jgi:hypothetical protein